MKRTQSLLLAAALAVGVLGPAQASESRRLRQLESSAQEFATALAAQRRGDFEAAEARYREALRLDPEFVESMVNLARVLMEQDRLDDAAVWIDRASVLRPDYPRVYSARGLLALRRGDLAAAVDDLSRARALAPEDPEVLNNLGAALIQRGMPAEAREVLSAADAAEPGRTETALGLAIAYDLLGDHARARFHYGRFLRLAPRDDVQRAEVESRLRTLTDHWERTSMAAGNGARRHQSGPDDGRTNHVRTGKRPQGR